MAWCRWRPRVPLIQDGRIRGLAITGAQALADGARTCRRSPKAAVPGFASTSWQGWFMPAKTPAAIVERIQQEIAQGAVVARCSQRASRRWPTSGVGQHADANSTPTYKGRDRQVRQGDRRRENSEAGLSRTRSKAAMDAHDVTGCRTNNDDNRSGAFDRAGRIELADTASRAGLSEQDRSASSCPTGRAAASACSPSRSARRCRN